MVFRKSTVGEWVTRELRDFNATSWGRLRRVIDRVGVGSRYILPAGVIGVAWWILFQLRGFRVFDDEADNLVGGRLIGEGLHLYRDYFSHHFPFPYYFFGLVFPVTGPSFTGMRVALLCFVIACVVVAAWRTGWWWTCAVTALVWASVGQFYLGHMGVYHTFSAAAFLVFSAVLLRAICSGPRWGDAWILAVSASIATLSDPLMALPTVVGLGVMVAIPSCRALGVRSIILGLGCALAVVGAMTASGILGLFWHQTFEFNAKIYAEARGAGLGILREVLWSVATAGDVFNERWWSAPVVPKEMFDGLQFFETLDDSILGGLGFRASMLGAALLCLLRKEYLLATAVYLLGTVTVGSYHSAGISAQPFVLFAIFVTALSCNSSLRGDGSRDPQPLSYARVGAGTLRGVLGAYLLSLMVVCGTWLFMMRGSLDVSREDVRMHARGDRYESLVPYPRGVRLGVYPSDTYLHLVTDMRPLGGFGYFWPWVAQYGTERVIAEIPRVPGILAFQGGGVAFGMSVDESLRRLREACAAQCWRVTPEIFLTPPLVGDRDFQSFAMKKWPKNRRLSLPGAAQAELFAAPHEGSFGSEVSMGRLRWPAVTLDSERSVVEFSGQSIPEPFWVALGLRNPGPRTRFEILSKSETVHSVELSAYPRGGIIKLKVAGVPSIFRASLSDAGAGTRLRVIAPHWRAKQPLYDESSLAVVYGATQAEIGRR